MSNPIVKSVFYPLISRWEGNGKLMHELKILEESQYWSPAKIQAVQFEGLKKLLKHAYEQTSFYRRRFDEHDIHPDKIQDFDDFKRIPVLTKADIRDNLDSMVARNFTPSQLQSSSSGGTTGLITKFFLDKRCLTPKLAAVVHYDRWTHWDIGEWLGLVWPATLEITSKTTWRSQVKNFLAHRKLKIALTVVDRELIRAFLQQLRERRATMIRAFPTPLTEVAKYMREHKMDGFSVKGIVTTGELLYPAQRQLIENAFQCKILDSYRTRETGPLAQECEHQNGYHIHATSVILETVPFPDSERPSGGDDTQAEGRVLVTDLANYGMPFIRYEIGDIGTLSTEKCPCGRGLPLLKHVAGRMVDVVYTPRGERIASITLIPNLVQAAGIFDRIQFIQDDLDHLTIRIEKPGPPKAVLRHQRDLIDRLFNAKMRVTYELVDEIPLLKSGKYAFIICKIPADRLAQLT